MAVLSVSVLAAMGKAEGICRKIERKRIVGMEKVLAVRFWVLDKANFMNPFFTTPRPLFLRLATLE